MIDEAGVVERQWPLLQHSPRAKEKPLIHDGGLRQIC